MALWTAVVFLNSCVQATVDIKADMPIIKTVRLNCFMLVAPSLSNISAFLYRRVSATNVPNEGLEHYGN